MEKSTTLHDSHNIIIVGTAEAAADKDYYDYAQLQCLDAQHSNCEQPLKLAVPSSCSRHRLPPHNQLKAHPGFSMGF